MKENNTRAIEAFEKDILSMVEDIYKFKHVHTKQLFMAIEGGILNFPDGMEGVCQLAAKLMDIFETMEMREKRKDLLSQIK